MLINYDDDDDDDAYGIDQLDGLLPFLVALL